MLYDSVQFRCKYPCKGLQGHAFRRFYYSIPPQYRQALFVEVACKTVSIDIVVPFFSTFYEAYAYFVHEKLI